MKTAVTHSASEAQSVLDAMVVSIDAERLNAHGVHVRVGTETAEHRWHPDERADVYSAAKGVSVLAAGIAVDEGIVSLDTRVSEALPAMKLGAHVDEVTLRHLLTMTSGIDFAWFAGQPSPDDVAQEMLQRSSHGPGRIFQYSDASTYVAMRMLSAHVGDVLDWLVPRLFEPLGIRNPTWLRCPRGGILGGSGLLLRTSELASIGRVLRDGTVDGRRVVARKWVETMHADWHQTGAAGRWARYGMGCWDGPGDGWRLDGLHGQYVYVSEGHDAVVTITAREETREHRLVEIAADALVARAGLLR